uniref:Uncharacterized protein n=1 Tax=Rhizophora mucronata TaxID=61149 RepID=A0A2P2P4Z7_RHIMU
MQKINHNKISDASGPIPDFQCFFASVFLRNQKEPSEYPSQMILYMGLCLCIELKLTVPTPSSNFM